MKIHERLTKAQEILTYKAPWEIVRFIGGVTLVDHGVAFGQDGDFANINEVHKVIDWMIEEFDYKMPVAAKATKKKTTKKSK